MPPHSDVKARDRLHQHWLWLLGLVLLGLFLLQSPSLAQPIADWASPRQQNSWISDRAELLSWQTELHLTRRINKLVGRTGAELAIATLPELATGESARELALNLFNTWRVGKRGVNTGVLVFVSKADRRIEIITGSGLGETLPDAEVGQLIQQVMVPAFQRQDYTTGMTQGITAIAQRLEARLPGPTLPPWLSTTIVWLPWVLAWGGAALAIVMTVRAIAFRLSRVQVPVPPQGIDTKTYDSKTDLKLHIPLLATEPFPQVLAQLFTPNEHNWQQEIPYLPLFYLCLGGLLSGIGVILGFWQFILMHPEAQVWQTDAAAWAVCAVASSGWFLWGMAMTSQFMQAGRFGPILGLGLLTGAGMAAIGGYLWVYQIPTWGGLMGVMVFFCISGGVTGGLILGDQLHFRRPRVYRSDRTGKPVQELTTEELEGLLTPEEKLARSMGKLALRGWREADLPLPLSREQVYLVQGSISGARRCLNCHSFAIESSQRTVTRTITTMQKQGKRKETVPSVKQVQQDVFTCCSCGDVRAIDRSEPSTTSSDGFSSASADDFSASSVSSDYTSSYDNTIYSSDDGSSASSDFGGGSSDGGGAGSDW